MHTFADSRINFTVILGVGEFSDQYRIKYEFIKRLHSRFRAEGISIPAPTRTVALHQEDSRSAPPAVALPVPHQREAPVPHQREAPVPASAEGGR